jgi:hypothetical protein
MQGEKLMDIRPSVSQVIQQLQATPEIIKLLASHLSDSQAAAKPTPNAWSVAEIVAHLAHTEEHCYEARVQRILDGGSSLVAAYDAKRFEREGAYATPFAPALTSLVQLRTKNVDRLRRLEPDDLVRGATHETVGAFTLEDLIYEWAAHDVGHIRQIAIVLRDVLYIPCIGPFRD